jgi:hypothetical protein
MINPLPSDAVWMMDVLRDGFSLMTIEAEGNWGYVPKEQIESLGLDKIRYSEKGGLLIRAEYEAALNAVYFHRENAIKTKSHGVIIIGQPGIGALFSWLFLPIIK